jgi:Tol biopolymer transport system component
VDRTDGGDQQRTPRRGGLRLAAVAALATAALVTPPTAAGFTPYAEAPFDISTGAYTFGQAPVFMPDGQVVFGKDFGMGTQVYIANRDGSGLKCLTCELPPPNNVPAVRPQGDWILFHSWMGHHITVGSPGYGGIGSELYAMRPDGSDVTKLYELSPHNDYGEGDDDYHAYWSPDGKRIVWAHFGGNFLAGEPATWDIRVANFGVQNGKPMLTDVRVVRPSGGRPTAAASCTPRALGRR